MISTISTIISATTLVVGVAFAIVQLRHFRAMREREVALELVHSFQTPEFAWGVRSVFELGKAFNFSKIAKLLVTCFTMCYHLYRHNECNWRRQLWTSA